MTASRQPPANAYRPVLAVVAASTLLAMTCYTGPFGNAVSLTSALSASTSQTTWILAAMSIGLAATLLAAGVVADRIGRLSVFGLGAAVFTVANLMCSLAPGPSVFIIGRVTAGIGATGMIATGLGLVAAVAAEHRHRSTTATMWSIMMGAGIAVGPVAAGALDLIDAWRAFYVILAAGGIAVSFGARRTRRYFPESAPATTAPPFDYLGFILLTGSLALLIAALVVVRTASGSAIVAVFTLTVALVVALVLSQKLGKRQLITPSLFSRSDFLAATAAAFGAGLGVVGVMAFAPTYFVGGLGMNTLQAGTMSALWAGTSAVAALALARYTARISGPTQLVIGLLGAGLGVAMMTGVSGIGDNTRLWGSLVVAGIAAGVLNSGLARQAVASVPPNEAATGTAANNTARYLGVAVGVSIASLIIASDTTVSGWNLIVWIGVGASLLAALVVVLLSRAPGRPARSPRRSAPELN